MLTDGEYTLLVQDDYFADSFVAFMEDYSSMMEEEAEDN